MKAAEAAEPYLVDLPDSYPRRPHESFPPAVSVVRGPRCPPRSPRPQTACKPWVLRLRYDLETDRNEYSPLGPHAPTQGTQGLLPMLPP